MKRTPQRPHPHRRVELATVALLLALHLAPLRRARGEDRIDFKYLYYAEEDGRVQVSSPALLLEKDLTPLLTLKIEGIYNAISGASPTGAPLATQAGQPTPASTEPYAVYVEDADDNEREVESRESDHEDGHEGEHEDGLVFKKGRGAHRTALSATRMPFRAHYVSGATSATPAPTPTPAAPSPAPSSGSSSGSGASSAPAATPAPAAAAPAATPAARLPRANVDDNRYACHIELSRKFDGHTLTGGVSLSSEEDYDSIGLSLNDAIDFNKKNTTLELGAALTHDSVDAFTRGTTESKDTLEGMVGFSQVLSPKTLFRAALTLGHTEGYLDDQYKVVSLDGLIVPERRPDQRDKEVVFVSLLHYVDALRGSAEASYRFYDDSFGIQAHTLTLTWHQKLGEQLTVSPMLRWYEQTEADFYGVDFSGPHDFYSSDYRLSALRALGYGIKVVWRPSPQWSVDLGVERYEQEGTDGITPSEAYPVANVISGGVRLWF